MADDHKKLLGATNWTALVIVLLLAILLAVAVWFGLDILNLYKNGAIAPAVSRLHRKPLSHITLTSDQIQGWMTFRYINHIFNLPSDYLAARLNISDSGYPNVTVDKYALDHNIDNMIFIQKVKDAVGSYQNGNSQ